MSITTIKDLAELQAKILKTDRWIFNAIDGEMGEGKSCFGSQLAKETAKQTGTPFNYQTNMTFKRKELKIWVDGDKHGKGKLPGFSSILADELVSMFFKRNWYDFEQIDGIELLNKCRDRHLCITGNIPNFWDLDSAIYSVITFWIHIDVRGIAWVFRKDRNPFASDKWHRRENEKLFRKNKDPYRCHGFVCEIPFEDWSNAEKERYYTIRNIKRKKTEGQRRKEERYRDIKQQRDELLRFAFNLNPKLTNKDVHNLVPSLSVEAVRLIRKRER